MIGILAAAATVGLGVAALVRLNRAAFRKRFPLVSDAEFLARIRPAVDPAVALRVRRLVAEHFAIEYERGIPSMSFTKDIGAD